jgi:RES domain-containing protein
VIVYRLTSARFPKCDGEGARLYGGRWNSQGRAVVYTAGTQSLAALEILAHASALGDDYVVVGIEIPGALAIEEIELRSLPDWHIATTRSIGDAWFARRASAVLRVPSKVIAAEFNYILNPTHDDFGQLTIYDPEPFRFDQRLLERFMGLPYRVVD